ncbi:MAG: response regulator transcription factor [Actinomycetota bacterium]
MARVMVVEDERTVQVLMQDLLEMWGHDVQAASSGDQAIALLSAHHYDLIVLDIMLGGISGYDVLDEMSRLGMRERTRVVIVTGRATEWDYLLGWMRGADEYLPKPFDPVRLQKVLEEMLSSSPEDLTERRRAELEKSQMLFNLESTFGEEDGPSPVG